jgi:hypothetical protein
MKESVYEICQDTFNTWGLYHYPNGRGVGTLAVLIGYFPKKEDAEFARDCFTRRHVDAEIEQAVIGTRLIGESNEEDRAAIRSALEAASATLQRVASTQAIRDLRLAGYDAIPCEKCGSLRTVRSEGKVFCEGCTPSRVMQWHGTPTESEEVRKALEAASDSIIHAASMKRYPELLTRCAEILSPKEGDVLVLRHRPCKEERDALLPIAEKIASETGAFVVLLSQNQDLSMVDEATMKEAGWIRKERVGRIAYDAISVVVEPQEPVTHLAIEGLALNPQTLCAQTLCAHGGRNDSKTCVKQLVTCPACLEKLAAVEKDTKIIEHVDALLRKKEQSIHLQWKPFVEGVPGAFLEGKFCSGKVEQREDGLWIASGYGFQQRHFACSRQTRESAIMAVEDWVRMTDYIAMEKLAATVKQEEVSSVAPEEQANVAPPEVPSEEPKEDPKLPRGGWF